MKVSHCSHLSFLWLNAVFQCANTALPFPISCLLSLDLSLSLSFIPILIFWLNLCMHSVQAQKINSREVSRGQWSGRSQSKVDYWLSSRQLGFHIGTPVTYISHVSYVSKPITRFEMWSDTEALKKKKNIDSYNINHILTPNKNEC